MHCLPVQSRAVGKGQGSSLSERKVALGKSHVKGGFPQHLQSLSQAFPKVEGGSLHFYGFFLSFHFDFVLLLWPGITHVVVSFNLFCLSSYTVCFGVLLHLVRSSRTSSCRISHTWLGFSLTLDCGYLTYLVMVLSHIWLWVLIWLLVLTYLVEVLDKLEASHTLGCSAHTYWLFVFTYLTVVVPHTWLQYNRNHTSVCVCVCRFPIS